MRYKPNLSKYIYMNTVRRQNKCKEGMGFSLKPGQQTNLFNKNSKFSYGWFWQYEPRFNLSFAPVNNLKGFWTKLKRSKKKIIIRLDDVKIDAGGTKRVSGTYAAGCDFNTWSSHSHYRLRSEEPRGQTWSKPTLTSANGILLFVSVASKHSTPIKHHPKTVSLLL